MSKLQSVLDNKFLGEKWRWKCLSSQILNIFWKDLKSKQKGVYVWKQGLGQNVYFQNRGMNWGSVTFYILPWKFPPEKRSAFNSSVLVVFLSCFWWFTFSFSVLRLWFSKWSSDPINLSADNIFFSKLIKMQARQWDMLEITNHLIS